MRLTWAANIALLIVKAFAYWASSSKAVLASLVDSVVDLLSQGVIAYAEMRAKVGCYSLHASAQAAACHVCPLMGEVCVCCAHPPSACADYD